PPDDLLRVVRRASAELHGPPAEHGLRRRLRALPRPQGRPLRGRRALAAAPALALRQELEGPARRDALADRGAERLRRAERLPDDLPARGAARPGRPAVRARDDRRRAAAALLGQLPELGARRPLRDDLGRPGGAARPDLGRERARSLRPAPAGAERLVSG